MSLQHGHSAAKKTPHAPPGKSRHAELSPTINIREKGSENNPPGGFAENPLSKATNHFHLTDPIGKFKTNAGNPGDYLV